MIQRDELNRWIFVFDIGRADHHKRCAMQDDMGHKERRMEGPRDMKSKYLFLTDSSGCQGTRLAMPSGAEPCHQ